MKNKLRKIIINNKTYYYGFAYKYKKLDYDWNCISSFRVFIGENKNTPFTIKCEKIADGMLGNMLNTGFGENKINLNCPKWAGKLIRYGIQGGWNGKEKIDMNCSYEFLEEILLKIDK